MDNAANTRSRTTAAAVYSKPTRTLAAMTWSICTFLSVNLLLTGSPGEIWTFLPWMLFIAWGIFMLLWRPQLLVRPDGLSIRNLLRDHEIPFSELTSLRVVQSVSFHTTAGRIGSWGAPGASKLGPQRLPGMGGNPAAVSLPPTQAAVESAWDAWERDRAAPSASVAQPGQLGKVETRWNVPTAVVGFLAMVLLVASLLT